MRNWPNWTCGDRIIVRRGGIRRPHRPGIFRDRFGFERWADFDEGRRETMATLRGEARRQVYYVCQTLCLSSITRVGSATAGDKLAAIEKRLRSLAGSLPFVGSREVCLAATAPEIQPRAKSSLCLITAADVLAVLR